MKEFYIITKKHMGSWIATCYDGEKFCYENDIDENLFQAIKFFDEESANKIASLDPLTKVERVRVREIERDEDCIPCQEKNKKENKQ